MVRSLQESAFDHRFDWRILDRQVVDRQVGKHPCGDCGDLTRGDLDILFTAILFRWHRGAVRAQVTRTGAAKSYANQFERSDAPRELVKASIVFQPAQMDDNDSFTQGGHVRHVMTGEQDGCAGTAVVFLDKSPDAHLGGDVQTDGAVSYTHLTLPTIYSV